MKPTRHSDDQDLINPVPGDIEKALSELGIEVSWVDGDEIYATCPAHERRIGKRDRTGRHWSVNSETGMHFCFACHFKGPFWTIVKEVTRYSDEEAVEWSKIRESHDKTMRLLFGGQSKSSDHVEIRESDLALYVPVPEDRCASRNLNPESADAFGVLWDPENLRWITPIREPGTDKLMGWQEKGLDRYFRNYPKGVEKRTTLFGANQVDSKILVIVESPLDAVRIHSVLGQECSAVSTFGSKISEEQLELIRDLSGGVVISALDDDAAGDDGNGYLLQHLSRQVQLRFWDYGDSGKKDPGDQTDDEIIYSFQNTYGRREWVPHGYDL